MLKRVHLIVLDSVGIGEAPDSAKFGDAGCDTLGHISERVGLHVPTMEKMGLGAIRPLKTVSAVIPTKGYVCKLKEQSAGKDTMTGHWELMGLITHEPFPVYPNGFSEELIHRIEHFSGRKVLCNRPYSGTEVINDYGVEQRKTGALIVYTSADPVLQIAAHEGVIPLPELYRICEYVRSITKEPPYKIGRIIARPYVGSAPGHFIRTGNRRDFALTPPFDTALDQLKAAKKDVIAIGKINDIFSGKGITRAAHTKNNQEGINDLLKVLNEDFTGLSFLNLVDFDAEYGHRRNPAGYARALEYFDSRLPEILAGLRKTDLLLITADHGNDPTFHGTDHTREYVPLLAYSPSFRKGGSLKPGLFTDVAHVVLENFGLEASGKADCLLSEAIRNDQ